MSNGRILATVHRPLFTPRFKKGRARLFYRLGLIMFHRIQKKPGGVSWRTQHGDHDLRLAPPCDRSSKRWICWDLRIRSAIEDLKRLHCRRSAIAGRHAHDDVRERMRTHDRLNGPRNLIARCRLALPMSSSSVRSPAYLHGPSGDLLAVVAVEATTWPATNAVLRRRPDDRLSPKSDLESVRVR